ncbi:DUF3667 domain-containing protein [Flavobacterium qiangtangense]|uniref:DUF3667 domain-containing protein n=1 Tax=Flavobacterium qiangtangense TaxID=1442595 RepID=UPI0036D332EE
MEHNCCLNCNESTEKNFCSNCGQKNETHRITLKHFFLHDVLHGVWHLEKGILFTLKQAMFRPGKAALDYINGKRISYYNVFYLILLLTAFGIFIENIYATATANYISYIEPSVSSPVLDILGKYVKFFLFLAIPVYAFNSYLLFNKKKYLYSEHLIIFGMYFLGIILITLFQNIIMFTEFVESLAFIADWSSVLVAFLLFPYIVNGLYGAFGKNYTKIGFALRTAAYIILMFLELRLLAIILKFYIKNYH